MKSKIHKHTNNKSVFGVCKKTIFLSITIILFVGMLFIIQSCQKEPLELITENTQKKVELLKFEDLSKTDNLGNHITNKVSKIAEKQIQTSKATSNNPTLILDTSIIYKTNNDGSATYTFNIMNKSEPNALFENFVINKFSENSYYFYIVHYYPNLDVENTEDFPYNIDITPINTENFEIINVSEIVNKGIPDAAIMDPCIEISYESCSAGGKADGHDPAKQEDGTYCTGSPTILDFSGCFDTVDGGGSSDDTLYDVDNIDNLIVKDENYSTGGSGSDTSDSRTSEYGEVYDPNLSTITTSMTVIGDYSSRQAVVLANLLGIDLNSLEGQQLLGALSSSKISYNEYQSLIDFLNQNPNSQEAKDFGKLAVQAFADGEEVNLVERVIFNFEGYPCHQMVVHETFKVCSPLTQIFQDIFEGDPNIVDTNYGITYRVGDINGNGSTLPRSRPNGSYDNYFCNIIVTFNENYISNATDLSIARTTIHETLHAYLIFLSETGVIDNQNPEPEFSDLFYSYIDYLLSNGLCDLNQSHHDFMADLVDDIATSLSEYGITQGYNLSFSYYQKLAWGGLTNSETFLLDYPETLPNGDINPECVDIINVIAAEQDNSSAYSDSNGNTIIPKGTQPNSGEPCE